MPMNTKQQASELTASSSSLFQHPGCLPGVFAPQYGCAHRHCSLLKDVVLLGASVERGQVLFYRLAADFLISLSVPHVQGSRANFIPPCTLCESLRRLFSSSPSLRWDQGLLGPPWLDLFLISSLTATSRVFHSFLLLQGSDGPNSTFLYLPEEHRGLSLILLL